MDNATTARARPLHPDHFAHNLKVVRQRAQAWCDQAQQRRARDEALAATLQRLRAGLAAGDDPSRRAALAALAGRYGVLVVEDARGGGARFRHDRRAAEGPAVDDGPFAFLHAAHEVAHFARGPCPRTPPLHYPDPQITDSVACLQWEVDCWFQVLRWIPLDRAQWAEMVRCLSTYVDGVSAPVEARENAVELLVGTAYEHYVLNRVRGELVDGWFKEVL